MAKHKQYIEIMNGVAQKQCTVCKEWKSLHDFAKDKGGIGGARSSCKACVRAYTKKIYYAGYQAKECSNPSCNNKCKTRRAKYCSVKCANRSTKKKKEYDIDPKWLSRGTPSTCTGIDAISNSKC